MFAGIQRERDPNLINLEQNVFGQLAQVGFEEDKVVGYIEPKKLNSNGILSSLSVEDAIKELLNMEKNLK